MTFRFSLIGLVAFCVITGPFIYGQDQNLADVRQKAEGGDPIAQFDLARAYINGKDAAKDPVQGLAWLRKSANQGYFGAEYALAIMYLNGAATLPKDPHEAGAQQNKKSQDRLSEMLAKGLISADEANWQTATSTVSKIPPQIPPHSPPGSAKDTKGKAMAFSFGEVETGLTAGITSKRMATLVQKFGVDFKLSSVTRKRLADEGADDSLLATISASKRSL
jgi:hypothetical protein